MKNKKILICISIIFFGIIRLHAQNNSVAVGNVSTGTGGNISFSVGQIAYHTDTGSNGSVAQGLQQVYEISTTLGIIETGINLELSVFPNPTKDCITLKVEDKSNLSFYLYDLQGKVIDHKKVMSNTTTISMKELPVNTYFLKVLKSNKAIKIFKIIKN